MRVRKSARARAGTVAKAGGGAWSNAIAMDVRSGVWSIVPLDRCVGRRFVRPNGYERHRVIFGRI